MNRQQMIDILLEENVNGDWTDNGRTNIILRKIIYIWFGVKL
jgi:hypothetical protein